MFIKNAKIAVQLTHFAHLERNRAIGLAGFLLPCLELFFSHLLPSSSTQARVFTNRR